MPSITQLSKGRSTTHLMHPDDILADHKYNGRFEDIPEPKDVIKGFLEVGQLQPVSIRPNPDKGGKPILAFGFRRWLAAKIINDRGLSEGAFLLECKILEPQASTDLEAFKRNIIENAQRTGVNPIDDAHNIRKLVTDYGLNKSEAAAVYGKDPSFASRRLLLLSLSPDLQQKVAKGELGVAAAEELSRATPEVQEQIGRRVRRGERVVADTVVTAGRDEREAAPGKEAEEQAPATQDQTTTTTNKRKAGRPKATTRTRTTKEVRVLIKGFAEDEDFKLASLGTLLASWMDGKLTDNGLRRKLGALLVKEEGK